MTKSSIFLILFFFGICISLIFFSTKGTVYSDEGYILHSAERITQGQIPYRDFPFVYTPFTLYMTAVSFFVFGKSILAGRLLMILISLGTCYILFRFLQQVTKSMLLIYIALLLYVSWGPFHIPFPWPVMFSVSLSMLFFYLIVIGNIRKNIWYFIGSGLLTFIAFLTKQNFGFAFLASFLVIFLSMPLFHKRKTMGAVITGFMGGGSIYLLYLLYTGSFVPFWHDFYLYTLKRIVFEQTLTTDFVIGESIVYRVIKMLFYLSPLILSGIVGILSYHKKRSLLFIPVFTAVFYLLGIRPTTDYIHLSPLLTFMGILFIILYQIIKQRWIKWIIIIMMGLFCFIGLYSAYFMGFYKWEPPFSRAKNLLALPKGYVYLDSFQHDEIIQLKKAVDKRIASSEKIYIYAYLPMLYFLLDRENATKYDLIEQTSFYNTTEKKIIKQLQEKNVRLIITIKTPGKTPLGEYIQKEYTNTEKVNGLFIWEKQK